MLNWVKGEVRRFRRSVAHGGVVSAVRHLGGRMVRSENSGAGCRSLTGAGVRCIRLMWRQVLDTSGYIHGGALAAGHANDAYIVAYYGSSPSLFRAAMERWQRTPGVRAVSEYAFVDIGCGKGRVVMMAAEMGFRECVGVELIEELATVAEANVERFAGAGRAVRPMRIVCGDALAFEYPKTPCLVFLFNPFTGKMLTKLLKRIATAFRDRPGELEIVYLNARYRDELLAEPGFEMLWEEALAMSEEDERIDSEYMGERCSAWRWVGIG